jgi:hypothetical protein
VSASTCSIPGPTDRSARLNGSCGASAGKLPLLIVQGVLLTRLARAPIRAAGRIVGRERGVLYNEQGRCRARRGDPDAGRGAGRLADSRQTGVGARPVARSTRANAHVRADMRAATSARRARRTERPRVRTTGAARTWLQASNPSERWKVGFHVSGFAAGQRHVDPSAVPAIGLIPLREVK